MKVGRSTMQTVFSLIGALALTGSWSSHASTQDARGQTSQHHGPTSDKKAPTSDLVRVVRESTKRFQMPAVR